MIELRSEFKPFFYISSVCLAAEVAFLIAFFVTPRDGWAIYGALLAISASVPLLAGATVAAMLGYMRQLRHLLLLGLVLFLLWLTLLFVSVSVLASAVFLFVALVSYKMLQYHYRDLSKASKHSDAG